MAIEWKPGREVIGAEASVGDLRLIVTPHGQGFRWYVLVRVDIIGSLSLVPVLGGSGQVSELADGRSVAETFAREWVARQARAFGLGVQGD